MLTYLRYVLKQSNARVVIVRVWKNSQGLKNQHLFQPRAMLRV